MDKMDICKGVLDVLEYANIVNLGNKKQHNYAIYLSLTGHTSRTRFKGET